MIESRVVSWFNLIRFDLETRDLIWNWFELIVIWFVIICDLNKSQVSVISAGK